jgi:transposase InsO family protein
VHANSPLTVRGRIMLVERVASGRPIAHVAAEMGISRKTVTKWWRRFQDEGPGGLEDRSSRPQRCPHRTPATVEQKILRLRTRWERAERFFAQHDIRIEAVLSDNAKNYLGKDFTAALGLIEHRRIRPRRPQTNGKVERFNRTLIDEWAYVRLYRSNAERIRALDRFLHTYNHHRGHTSRGGRPPISATNQPGQHS